jgi:hypothetical protein
VALGYGYEAVRISVNSLKRIVKAEYEYEKGSLERIEGNTHTEKRNELHLKGMEMKA